MAEETKERFPNMPTSSWWTLRKKFRSSIPAKVTSSYLASVLQTSEDSARSNVLPSLEVTGLVDSEGKPTDRAVRWRDDAQYSNVCKEIKEEVYPQELLDLSSDNDFDRNAVKSWFANYLAVGDGASRRFAAIYSLLNDADLAEGNSASETSRTKSNGSSRAKVSTPKLSKPDIEESHKGDAPIEETRSSKPQPSLHINVQIHISPESSAEQIDAIFSSMGKYLKDFS